MAGVEESRLPELLEGVAPGLGRVAWLRAKRRGARLESLDDALAVVEELYGPSAGRLLRRLLGRRAREGRKLF